MKMLNSYSAGCQMNETHVFYTATNTFRNPLFEPLAEDGDENESPAIYQPSQAHHKRPPPPPPPPQVAANKPDQSHAKVEDAVGGGGQPHGDQQRSKLQKSCSSDASMNSNQSELNARWREFCDSLGLTIMGRLFVMETNFKRRLRAVRKYLDRRWPWLLAAGSVLQAEAKRERRNNQQRRRNLSSAVSSAAAADDHHDHCFKFPEPKSASALNAQQECLLNRLKRIKRQQLFSLPTDEEPSSSSSSSLGFSDGGSQETTSSAQATQPTDSIALPGSGGQPPSSSSGGRRRSPIGLFSSIESQPTDWQPAESGSKQAGKRSRWIDRSRRQLRDTARALTSPKKLCVVCYVKPANIVTLPCKHGDICSDCFIEVIYTAVSNSQYPLRCVLCRQKVEKIRCSRRLLLDVMGRNGGL